jgi:hypothetical protein
VSCEQKGFVIVGELELEFLSQRTQQLTKITERFKVLQQENDKLKKRNKHLKDKVRDSLSKSTTNVSQASLSNTRICPADRFVLMVQSLHTTSSSAAMQKAQHHNGASKETSMKSLFPRRRNDYLENLSRTRLRSAQHHLHECA